MKYLQGSNISRDESYEDFSYSTKPAAILLATVGLTGLSG
jgi:hypothetical protein